MFVLTDDELGLKILGCGDGPASFNSEATRRGSEVISCDPIYRYDVDQLRDRIASTYDEVLEQARRNAHEFVWSFIHSVEELGQVRMAAMNDFYRVNEAPDKFVRIPAGLLQDFVVSRGNSIPQLIDVVAVDRVAGNDLRPATRCLRIETRRPIAAAQDFQTQLIIRQNEHASVFVE